MEFIFIFRRKKNTKEIDKQEKKTVKGSIAMLMAKSILDYEKTEKSMEKGYCNIPQAPNMTENGKKIKPQAMESFSTPTATNTRDSD